MQSVSIKYKKHTFHKVRTEKTLSANHLQNEGKKIPSGVAEWKFQPFQQMKAS